MENNFDSFDDICVEEIEGCEAHEAEADYDAEQAELLQKVQDNIKALPRSNEYDGIMGVGYDLLMQMVDCEFISEDDPVGGDGVCTLGELMGFMEEYPKAEAFGFCHYDENGVCVVFHMEGLEYHGPVSAEMKQSFTDCFRCADDFVVKKKSLYCWFD